MNRALIDPFQHSSYPETIEEYLERGLTKCLAFNRRGTILAAGCQNGEVVLWDFDTRGILRVFPGHKAAVTAVAWTRNGRQLLSASQTGEMLVHDVLKARRRAQGGLINGGGVWGVLAPPPLRPPPALGRFSVQPSRPHPSRAPPAPLPSRAQGEPVLKVALGAAVTMLQAHPGDRDCALASCAGAAPVLVDLKTGAKTPLPLSAPEMGDDAPTGGRRGGADALSGQAVFSKGGESAFVGTTKGWLFLVDLASVSVREGLRLSGGASVKHLALSRSGTVLLANCGDRTIRTFDVAAAAPPPGGAGEGEKALRAARDFKNAVSAVQWGAAALSADSDYVVGASGGNGEHLLYVWLRQHGTLEKILEGPQTATVNQVAWHPKRCVLAALSGDGRIYLWAKILQENWSAFAPDFKELDENEEYVEREDEFDAEPEGAAGAEKAGAAGEGDGDGDVDIETVEPALADSDDDEVPDALHYLPLAPDRDERLARRAPPPGQAEGVGAGAAPAKAEVIDEEVAMRMLLNDGPDEGPSGGMDVGGGAAAAGGGGKRGQQDAAAQEANGSGGAKRARPDSAAG